ncbi:MAG: SCO family protein [Ignavibacteriae bacterium]|nr:SCO family protein [Ignavibacteriota bacterium]
MKLNLMLIFIIIFLVLISCKAGLEELEDLNKHSYSLFNQDSLEIKFPKIINEKIAVVGYIFSNCVDVCPLTTNNMRLIQEELNKQKIQNVEFISISFDPDVDKPSVLKSFAKVRDLNLANWHFLTGSKDVIDSLMKNVGMVIIKSDSTVYENGLKTYYYVHTDRIQLIDQKGIVRRNYIGSKINILEIVNDIKSLSNK